MGSGEPDRGQRARWEAEHPDRSAPDGGGSAPTRGRVPDGGQSARWEAVHLDRTAPDGKQSATRGCAPGQKCTRWGVEHPMGSSTPGQNGCNAHRSGVAPSPTSTNEAHCRLPGHEAPLRLVGQSAVRVGRRRAWAIDVDRGACGDDGRPAAPTPAPGGSRCVLGATQSVGPRRGSRCVWGRWLPRRAHPRAGWIAVRVGGDAGVGHRRGSWRSLCVSRRPRPCRCRDGCRETRAPGEPGRWPLRR